jgi:PAS domain S-box-containing protein
MIHFLDRRQFYLPLRFWLPLFWIFYSSTLVIFLFVFHRQQESSWYNISLAVGALSALAIGTSALFSMVVTRRVSHLIGIVNQFVWGDLTTRVTLPGADEFVAIGAAFHQMAEQLAAQRQKHEAAEAALQANQELMQDLLARLDVVVWSSDYDQGYYHYISPSIEQIYGHPVADFQQNRNLWWEIIYPIDLPLVLEAYDLLEATGAKQIEFRIIHPDGTIRWLSQRSLLVCDAAGRTRRYDGLVTDITAYKQEQAVLAERMRLDTLRAEVGTVLAQSNALPVILQKCAEAVVMHLDAAFVRIWTFNAESQLLELQASAGLYTHLDGSHSQIAFGQFIVGQIAQQRLPHVTNDLLSLPQISDRSWARREGIVAFAGYPLIVEGTVVGVMAAFARQPFSPTVLDNFAFVAGSLAQLIERKQTEAALRASEERFRLAVEGARHGMWDWNVATGAIVVNRQWATLLGYELHEIAPHIDFWNQLLHPDDRPLIDHAFQAHEQGRSTLYECEHRVRTKDGEWKWVFDRAQIVSRDIYNQALRVTGILEDITARRQAEIALRQSEARIRVILDSLPDPVFVSDKEGILLDSHSSVPELYYRPPAEFLGKCITEVIPGLVGQQIRRAIVDAAKGTRQLIEYPLPIGGELRHFEARLAPLDADQVLTIVRDVTKQKRAEEERFIRKIAEAVPHAMYVYDLAEERYVYINEQARQNFGYSPEEIMRMGSAFFTNHLHDDDRARFPELVARWDGAGNGQIFETEYQLRHPNGEWRWFAGRDTVFHRNPDGRVHQIIGTAHDVTEYKRAQRQILAALKEKEALLKEVHHRVKNNLQIITSLLNLQAAQIKDTTVLQIFTETKNRVRSMALLHETLYSTENLARIDFTRYVESLCAHLFRSYGVDPQRICLQIAITGVTLDLDQAIPCGLIINELVSNAIKYAFPDDRTGTIGVALQAHTAQQYQLCVRDNGIGLPVALDLTRTKSLGLRLVHDLALQLNGELTVTRTAGATFTILFAS